METEVGVIVMSVKCLPSALTQTTSAVIQILAVIFLHCGSSTKDRVLQIFRLIIVKIATIISSHMTFKFFSIKVLLNIGLSVVVQ